MLEALPNEPSFVREIFANRTLNMRSLRAIGYDMDYTVVHYQVKAWESVAFDFLKQRLLDLAWPLSDAKFIEDFGIRGLVIDRRLGNIVKANRFGYIKHAVHAFSPLDFDLQKETYGRDFVDLSDPRWSFVNTFFSLSELCIFAHAVKARDEGRFAKPISYEEISDTIRRELDEAHIEGALKAAIAKAPERFIDLDSDAYHALRDQREAGKKVILITNSEWPFTDTIMTYTFNRYMERGQNWRDLFDLIIVSARKPLFFTQEQALYRVLPEQNLLEAVHSISPEHKIYHGGTAKHLEQFLGYSGDAICYVGDHVYSDVNISKAMHRWRTCLISRELEGELEALEAHRQSEKQLQHLMTKKEKLDRESAHLRLSIQKASGEESRSQLYRRLNHLRAEITQLEEEIRPLAIASSQLINPNWGLLLRCGNDKSLMARQIEQHADIYTSRVSNFYFRTPYAYFRSTRGIMPHDLRLEV